MATPDEKNRQAPESKQKVDGNPVIENKKGTTGKGDMNKLWIIIAVQILVVAAILVFGLPYFMENRVASENGPTVEQKQDEEAQPGTRKTVKATLALDPFLVNLADKDEVRFVKTSFQLGLAEEPDEEKIGMTTAAMRDSIITLLSSKTAEQILTPQGKEKLREQIQTRVNAITSDIEVVEVYIVDFVVQL
jgi:flagellar FliL protein